MLKLEALRVDTHVAGIEPSAPVKVLYVEKAGDAAADITYELLDGRVLTKTLFRADEAKLSVVESQCRNVEGVRCAPARRRRTSGSFAGGPAGSIEHASLPPSPFNAEADGPNSPDPHDRQQSGRTVERLR